MSRIASSILASSIAFQGAVACLAAPTSSSAPADSAAQTSSGCVVLTAPAVDPESRGYARVLARELFRQAFLLAAREEFGASTRDELLREDGPAASGGKSFRVQLDSVGPGLTLQPKLYRLEEGGKETEWSGEAFRIRVPSPLDYRDLAARAEALSRDAFPGVLISAGFTRSVLRSSEQQVPADLDKQLAALNLVDQYAAVRGIHALIRTRGASPELLGALVRGYAHLSILTESHWNVSHKVFLARSILYAQRMKTAYASNPSGSFHLAYALALGGMHGLALEECAEAKRLANGSTPPEWLEMIEATCRFDNRKLEELAKSGDGFSDLACLLRLLQCESNRVPTKECELANDLLQRQPHCLRLLALLSRSAPITEKHVSTSTAFYSLDEMVRKRVSRLPELPRQVSVVIAGTRPIKNDDDSDGIRDWRVKRVELIQTLQQAGSPERDRGEPSWATLGRLIEEEWFVASFERAWFVKKTLSIDPGDEVDTYLPLLPDHPYRTFLALCGIPSGEEKRQLEKLMGQVLVPDPDVQMTPMFRYIHDIESSRQKNSTEKSSKKRRKPDIYDRLRASADDISRDLLNDFDSSNPSLTLNSGELLLKISPHHPLAAAQIVKDDWKSAEPQLASWEKEFDEHPVFVREVARHYQDKGPPDLAEKYTKKLIELAPEVGFYRELADLYKEQNQPDKYVSTLQEALKLPELGLDHARVRVRLAEHYMEKSDYETALPYAKQAAESGAGDCLLCLSRCYEGMGNMRQAEKWVRACSEHYRMSAYLWYFWCKRTGLGDVESARQLAESCLVPRDLNRSGEGETYGVYLQLAGEPRQAMEVFLKDFRINWNPNSGMHCAVLAFKMNNRKLHDEVLQEVIDRSSRSKELADRRAPKIELARLIRSASEGTLDPRQVDAIIKKAPTSEAVNVEYFAGRFFEAYGNQSLANDYLLRAARRLDRTDKFTHVLACDRCRQLGLKIATQPAMPHQ